MPENTVQNIKQSPCHMNLEYRETDKLIISGLKQLKARILLIVLAKPKYFKPLC